MITRPPALEELANVEAPEFENVQFVIAAIPKDEVTMIAIAVVPRFPLQLKQFIPEDEEELEYEMPVAFVQFN